MITPKFSFISGGVQLFLRMRNAYLDHADVLGPSWDVCNYFDACAMPIWITPMSRVHHGTPQLFLRMRNAYLDHAGVQGPSWEVCNYFYACALRNAYLDHADVQIHHGRCAIISTHGNA